MYSKVLVEIVSDHLSQQPVQRNRLIYRAQIKTKTIVKSEGGWRERT